MIPVNVLVQLAPLCAARARRVAARRTSGSEAWRESIVQPVSYSVFPAFSNWPNSCGKTRREK